MRTGHWTHEGTLWGAGSRSKSPEKHQTSRRYWTCISGQAVGRYSLVELMYTYILTYIRVPCMLPSPVPGTDSAIVRYPMAFRHGMLNPYAHPFTGSVIALNEIGPGASRHLLTWRPFMWLSDIGFAAKGIHTYSKETHSRRSCLPESLSRRLSSMTAQVLPKYLR